MRIWAAVKVLAVSLMLTLAYWVVLGAVISGNSSFRPFRYMGF